MQIEINSKYVRNMAERIVKNFPQVEKPTALEMVAQSLGYRNFDTLSGLLKKEAKALRKSNVSQLLAKPVMLWMESFVVGDYGNGPEWVNVELTAEYLESMLKQRDFCKERNLSHTSEWADPTDWQEEPSNPFNMRDWQLYVTEDSFWFRAHPKHCDYAVETRAVSFEELLKLLQATTGGGTSFQWIDGALYHDSEDAQALFDNTHEPEIPALGVWELWEVAELANKEGVNFYSLSEEERQPWIAKFLEQERERS